MTFDKSAGYPVKALSKVVKEVQKKKPDVDVDADTGGQAKAAPKVDPRKFVEINPKLSSEKRMVESRSQTKIDYLIRLGLGDQDRLTFYRQVMADPGKANQTPYLRKYVAEVLDLLLDLIFNDTVMYNRLHTKLQHNLPSGGVRKGITKIDDALTIKADKSGISLDILKEVYDRGLHADGGNQEKAFSRVNSFIAGGLARKMDADLDPNGVGTDAVTKRYADMTPGQNFALIKKALKGNNHD